MEQPPPAADEPPPTKISRPATTKQTAATISHSIASTTRQLCTRTTKSNGPLGMAKSEPSILAPASSPGLKSSHHRTIGNLQSSSLYKLVTSSKSAATCGKSTRACRISGAKDESEIEVEQAESKVSHFLTLPNELTVKILAHLSQRKLLLNNGLREPGCFCFRELPIIEALDDIIVDGNIKRLLRVARHSGALRSFELDGGWDPRAFELNAVGLKNPTRLYKKRRCRGTSGLKAWMEMD
ncbi:unnamed protein product [Sphagnum tenellum]